MIGVREKCTSHNSSNSQKQRVQVSASLLALCVKASGIAQQLDTLSSRKKKEQFDSLEQGTRLSCAEPVKN